MSAAPPDPQSTRVVVLPPCEGAIEGAARLEAALDADAAGAAPGIVRIEQPVGPVDSLRWIAAARGPRRSYFRSRDGGTAVAGLGTAAAHEPTASNAARVVERCLGSDEEGALRYFVTCRFDRGGLRLVLPRVELREEEGDGVLAVHLEAGGDLQRETEDAKQILARATATRSAPSDFGAVVVGESPDPDGWRSAVRDVLAAIESGELEKCVLARTRTYAIDGDLDPFELLRVFADAQPGTFRFGVQEDNARAFIGATPELLFRRCAGVVESEALAGTRRRPPSEHEARALEAELLESAKDRAEQAHVTEHIRSVLAPLLAEEPSVRGPAIRRLSGLVHLETRIGGTPALDASDAAFLAALHPTPAVCGVPTRRAAAAIARLEPFDRGLYGGAIGLLGRNESIVAVGIRSALLEDDCVTIFAGAGIVAGSDPDAEWTETGDKMRGLDDALRSGRAR